VVTEIAVSRQPLMTDEMEEKLKIQLTLLWTGRTGEGEICTAKEIARRLKFGVPGTDYEKLKVHSVYHYRSKFDLPRRKEQTMHTFTEGGRTRTTRYKTQPKEVMKTMKESPGTYLQKIKDTYPLDILEPLIPVWEQLHIDKQEMLKQMFRDHLLYSAYNIVQMYSPLRKSEIYERTFKDISITIDDETKTEYLTIGLFRKKKGEHSQQYLPYDIRLANPGMDIVKQWLDYRLEEVDKNHDELVFPISSFQAWSSVKKVDPDVYPHYFRFEYITNEFSDPAFSIVDIQADIGLHIVTIQRYLQPGTETARTSARRKRERLDQKKTKENE